MNPVCPGFMAHHVKPNRCRRCFRDLHDHDANKDVSTSFTIPLPRRRRESVAIAESSKKSDESQNDSSASFTFSSLGRRPRQRSSSTSSWFQEKKDIGVQKEKIDSLFKNAEDSIQLFRKRDDDEDTRENSPFTVRHRWQPAEHPTMTKSRVSDSTSLEVNSIEKKANTESNRTAVNKFESRKTSQSATVNNVSDVPDDSKSKTSAVKDISKTNETKSSFTKPSDVRSRSFKLSEIDKTKETPPQLPPKTVDSKTDLIKINSKPPEKTSTDSDQSKTKNIESSKIDTKIIEKKPVMSRFLDSRWGDPKSALTKPSTPKPVEPKPLTVRRDSKVGSVLMKFEAPSIKDKPPDKLITTKTSDEKKKDVTETKKAEIKPVMSRFSTVKKEEPKPVVSKPKEPSSSSSEESESESESEEESEDEEPSKPPPTIQKTQAVVTKPPEQKPLFPKPVEQKQPFTKSIEQKQPPTKPAESKQSLTRFTEPVSSTKLTDKLPPTKITDQKAINKTTEQNKFSVSLTEKKESKISENSASDVAFVVKLKPSPPATLQDDKVKEQQVQIQKQESKISELQKTIEMLKKDLKKTEENCSKLEREKTDIQKKKQQQLDRDKEALERTATELSKLRTKVSDMQFSQEQVREENKKLKTEVDKSKREQEKSKTEIDKLKNDFEKMKQEAEKAKQEVKKKESTIQQQISNQQLLQDPKSKQTIDQLKQKLQQTETLCQELMEENEDIKKEVRDLEQELEELHDNFREDQASEFRGLKKELETATKNCRVLQFKLRKAEKKCEQQELDRHSLEEKLKEFQLAVKTNTDKGRTKELENELKMSKSLTATLTAEIDAMRAALQRSEAENEMLRQQDGGTRSLTPTSRRSPITGREGMATPLGKDYESLTRELYDTMERENDLREQLKFSEEEAKTSRRKISTLEQENETLMLQMKKLNNLLRVRKDIGGSNKEKMKKKEGEKDVDEEEEEELSADNLKLQLDLQEQEMGVMRRKVEETEKENENLQSEVKYLQEKLINQPLIKIPDLPEETTGSTAGSVYWEKKARLLEYELRETRKKTIEKEREIERLNTEVEIYRKKASKMMVRSRSLDSDLQVDLKRQLQLVEQEATILRQKLATLENENEKLTIDNKRLTLRVSKKPPLTSEEITQLDNLELKQKNEDLQRKLETLKEELLEKTGQNDNPVAILQDYKPRRESLSSLTDNENDLIHSLKKKMKSQEDEHQVLQNKFMHLEIEHNRLSREHRRLKEALNTRKRPMKAIHDSATRVELKELITELQDEISELQVSLRGREVMQESLEEELERSQKELREAFRETKQKEDKLKEELDKGRKEKENLKKEAEVQKKRASDAQSQLNQVSGQLGADQMQLSQKVRKLQEELEETERKVKAAEESLEKKTRKLRETQEKLNSVTVVKEDLMRTNRLLQSQKDDVAKELEDHKELLNKAETRIKELRHQMENTDRDVTSLRKECNQLRNELEDERSRLKQMDHKSSMESNSMWTKERDDLRRANGELRTKVENLQHQITHNEQIWIEKEARMRDDFKRKKEGAVREAREKGEAALALAKEEEKLLRNKLQEMSEKLEKMETSVKESQEKVRQAASQHRRDKEEWQLDREDMEGKLRSEVKKRERYERESEQALSAKDEELLKTKDRLVQLEREHRRIQMQLDEAEQIKQKCAILEKEVDRLRQEYDDLTSKYDQLEEEFVKTKSKFVQEKENAEVHVQCLQRDVNNLTAEITALKETMKTKQDAWAKEKEEFQEQVKDSDRRLEKLKILEQERSRLKNVLEEKETLVDSYRKEEKHLKEERDKLRRNLDEMSRASDAQRQAWISSATSGSDPKAAKEVNALRADYEGKMTMMGNEIANMQSQISALVKERDALKARLNSAERSAEELKTGSLKRERARHREEADLARRKVKELKTQLEEVKEQIEDTVLENKNLKLQIETDRNSSEIEILELKSKINQLEEQKILETTRGQTRNLARTRLELAWEKERGEQQHLLAESQKLVTDLKNRLEAAEVEREKEKQALRRQVNHVREVAEKEQQENRRKMTELHSSLLEIRESQAKLRGLYDRMKREREMLLSERDEWRQRLQLATQMHAKVQELQTDVEKVTAAADSNQITLTPELKETLVKVKEQFTALQKAVGALKDDDRFKRTTSFRRAVSAQEMNLPVNQDPSHRWNQPQRITNYPVAPPSMVLRPPPRLKALHRKSLSLDHTLTGTAQFRDSIKIWESEGESAASTPAGSLLSLRMGGGYGYESDSSFTESEYKYGGSLQEYHMRRRYMQTPSGMSTDNEGLPSSREGSIATSCESVPAAVQRSTALPEKKSSTLKDKLKLLRRAKSIEVTNLSAEGSKEAKEKSLRSKISKVLKKPLGRSVSMDVHKSRGPALPPKGALPENAPKRPTSEKPLSASRSELSSSTQRPLTPRKTAPDTKSGRETPL